MVIDQSIRDADGFLMGFHGRSHSLLAPQTSAMLADTSQV